MVLIVEVIALVVCLKRGSRSLVFLRHYGHSEGKAERCGRGVMLNEGGTRKIGSEKEARWKVRCQ